jgi:hypothetical protein
MNLVTIVELYRGSGRTSRLAATLLLGIITLRFAVIWLMVRAFQSRITYHASRPLFLSRSRFLRPLRAILGPALFAPLNADSVQRPTNYVVSNSRQVLNAAAADQHDRVLLQIVPDPRDIRGDFNPVRQTNARHFAQGRIRLLRRLRIDPCANAAFSAGLNSTPDSMSCT